MVIYIVTPEILYSLFMNTSIVFYQENNKWYYDVSSMYMVYLYNGG